MYYYIVHFVCIRSLEFIRLCCSFRVVRHFSIINRSNKTNTNRTNKQNHRQDDFWKEEQRNCKHFYKESANLNDIPYIGAGIRFDQRSCETITYFFVWVGGKKASIIIIQFEDGRHSKIFSHCGCGWSRMRKHAWNKPKTTKEQNKQEN